MLSAMKKERKPVFTWFTWVVLGSVAVFFGVKEFKAEQRGKRLRAKYEAINNARQIGFALFEFEREYGRFPDAKTAAMLREKGKTGWKLEGNTSNDWFRQLIASGHVKDERIFYSKTAYTEKPDGKVSPIERALAAGEVGFGYLMNGDSAFSTEGNPARPIAVAPLAFDGKTVSSRTFDVGIFDHKAVVLRVDNSVQSVPILKKTKEAMLGGGKTLLETGPDAIWGDKVRPVIVPPLPKP